MNEVLLNQLKASPLEVFPDTKMSDVEFIPSANTITQLEARITRLEKLVDKLRASATEKTEKPKQKGDLEIFESNIPKEDENISILNDILQKPFKIDYWDEIKF